MSAELYWKNLGVSDPDSFREEVTQYLRNVRNYVHKAENRLFYRTYTFKFKIERVLVSPKNPLSEGLSNYRGIYADSNKRQRINGEVIDRSRVIISLKQLPQDLRLYFDFGTNVKPVDVRIEKVTLSNIEPIDVNEEEEDLALDLLYEQSEKVYNFSSKNEREGLVILEKKRSERLLFLSDVPSEEKIIARYNTHVMKMECQALDNLALRPKPHHLPLLNLLQRTKNASWNSVYATRNIEYHILKDESKAGIDEQRDFVTKALGTPDFAILEGPPGSGKTTTILEIILQLIPQHKRVMLVASTHVAVDNVIEKLLETTENGVSLIEKYGIVPLRVGDIENVSEKVRGYHVNNFMQSEKNRLIEFLGRHKKLSDSQKILYEALCSEDRGATVIENIALESANLVCGTTIGILQSKFIKNANESKPAFDYLIIDEASKTTFQEFLVPALHAERWILSGDIMQLAPYVDSIPIRENLANLPTLNDEIGKEDKRICLAVFRSIDSNESKSNSQLLLCQNLEDLAPRIQAQVNGIDKVLASMGFVNSGSSVYIAPERPKSLTSKLNLISSNVIFSSKTKIGEIEEYLPPNLYSKEYLSDNFERRKKAFMTNQSNRRISDYRPSNDNWEDEIAWRLSRIYQLRAVKDKQSRFKRDLYLLMPMFDRSDFIDKEGTDKRRYRTRADFLMQEIQSIQRIALPSVLELLQKGYERNETLSEDSQIPLYDGLPEKVFADRHSLLVYQHRMHPDISSFPREFIYEDKALKDSPDLQNLREWTYTQYKKKAVWINVSSSTKVFRDKKGNYNQREVEVISKHFKKFINWSKDNPNTERGSNGYWKVALLTFYKGQEKEFSQMMKSLGFRGVYYFESRPNNVQVEVCTVDRFQGHEADLVFLSFVNTNNYIGFLDNPNRLNVALTRAKYQLVIVGDRKTFKNSNQSTDLLRNLEGILPEGPIEF